MSGTILKFFMVFLLAGLVIGIAFFMGSFWQDNYKRLENNISALAGGITASTLFAISVVGLIILFFVEIVIKWLLVLFLIIGLVSLLILIFFT